MQLLGNINILHKLQRKTHCLDEMLYTPPPSEIDWCHVTEIEIGLVETVHFKIHLGVFILKVSDENTPKDRYNKNAFIVNESFQRPFYLESQM